MKTAPGFPTPQIYPTAWTLYSLDWDMLQETTMGGATTPLCLAGKQSTKVNRPLACGLFQLYPPFAL